MTPGPFALEMTIKDREGQLPERSLIRQGFFANLPLTARFPVEFQQRPFRLTLTLDDSLAYMHDLDPAIGNVQLIT